MLKQFRDWLRSGEKSPDDLLRLCLEHIAEREPEIRAWVEVCPQPPLGEGDLSGIPFGVKDIFETRGIATEYGSLLYAGRKGDRDAALVTDLRRRGAIMLGKTQTTAFAYFDPAPTRNPRDLARSPGGSSSGSAAAVAAGMVPFALGSQTQGSVIRPASYCEVTGFKPTYGRVPTDGVLPFAPSLDTVGYFTGTPEDMQILWGATAAEPARRIAPPPPEVPAILPEVRIVNDYEGARTHEARWREHGDAIGRKLAELVERGLAIPRDRYLEALDRIAAARTFMRAFFEEYDVVLSPASTGPPPLGLESTGDPSANSPWTALGVPVICVPRAGGIGLQIAAGWDREPMLLATAIQYYANESKFRLQ